LPIFAENLLNPTQKKQNEQNVYQILLQNKNKHFIKRILDPGKYPTLDNKDGSTSTHSMSWAEVDGKYIVYPTVLYGGKGKGLKRYDPEEALDIAIETKNFIEFDSPDEADWFSKEYKTYWNK